MKSLKETIMHRDDITSDEADKQIKEAQEELQELLAQGDDEAAYEVCQIYFGLEPDYLMDLL